MESIICRKVQPTPHIWDFLRVPLDRIQLGWSAYLWFRQPCICSESVCTLIRFRRPRHLIVYSGSLHMFTETGVQPAVPKRETSSLSLTWLCCSCMKVSPEKDLLTYIFPFDLSSQYTDKVENLNWASFEQIYSFFLERLLSNKFLQRGLLQCLILL
jgi:hypothetical protein